MKKNNKMDKEDVFEKKTSFHTMSYSFNQNTFRDWIM